MVGIDRSSWAEFFKAISFLNINPDYVVDDKRKVNSDYLAGLLERKYGQQVFVVHSDELINDLEEDEIFEEIGGFEARFDGVVYFVNNTSFELNGVPYKVSSDAIPEFINSFYANSGCLLFDGGDVIVFGRSGSQYVLLIYHHECRSLAFRR